MSNSLASSDFQEVKYDEVKEKYNTVLNELRYEFKCNEEMAEALKVNPLRMHQRYWNWKVLLPQSTRPVYCTVMKECPWCKKTVFVAEMKLLGGDWIPPYDEACTECFDFVHDETELDSVLGIVLSDYESDEEEKEEAKQPITIQNV
jgi:hypothetical protein